MEQAFPEKQAAIAYTAHFAAGDGVLVEQKNLTVVRKISTSKKFDVEKFEKEKKMGNYMPKNSYQFSLSLFI